MTDRLSWDVVERVRKALCDGLTVSEAADLVQINRCTIYRARARGDFDAPVIQKSKFRRAVNTNLSGIPNWIIKLDLVADFRDLKRDLGEDYALHACRKLSAEARA